MSNWTKQNNVWLDDRERKRRELLKLLPKTPALDPYIPKSKRTKLDRFFDVLQIGQYAVMGGLYNATDGDDNTGVLEGVAGGVKAGNPFGEGNEEGEHYFSEVLGNTGWKPESTAGKITKGVAGFAGDVFLDPSTYLTGGLGAVVKGTGKKVGSKTVEAFTKEMAEESLKELAKKSGKKGFIPKADDVDDLVRRMNDLKGIARKENALEFGTKYIPFREKLKIPLINKTLVNDKVLREFGDKTVAPYFNKMLDVMKSSKVTKHFNPKHELQTIIKSNPGEVVKFLKAVDYIKDLKMSQLDKEKYLKSWVEENLNFTPSELKQITNILEMPNKKVVESFGGADFAKTKQGASYKQDVEYEVNELQKKVKQSEANIRFGKNRLKDAENIDVNKEIRTVITDRVPGNGTIVKKEVWDNDQITANIAKDKERKERMTKIVSFLKSRGIKGVNPSVSVSSTVTPKNTPMNVLNDSKVLTPKDDIIKAPIDEFKPGNVKPSVTKDSVTKERDYIRYQGKSYTLPKDMSFSKNDKLYDNIQGEIFETYHKVKGQKELVGTHITAKRYMEEPPINFFDKHNSKSVKGLFPRGKATVNNMKNHMQKQLTKSNSDKLELVKSMIDGTPILAREFEGFKLRDALKAGGENRTMNANLLNAFIKAFYTGKIDDILKMKHKFHDNYRVISRQLDVELKNFSTKKYESLSDVAISDYGHLAKLIKDNTDEVDNLTKLKKELKIALKSKKEFKNHSGQFKMIDQLKTVDAKLKKSSGVLTELKEIRNNRMKRMNELIENPSLIKDPTFNNVVDDVYGEHIHIADTHGERYIDDYEFDRKSFGKKKPAGLVTDREAMQKAIELSRMKIVKLKKRKLTSENAEEIKKLINIEESKIKMYEDKYSNKIKDKIVNNKSADYAGLDKEGIDANRKMARITNPEELREALSRREFKKIVDSKDEKLINELKKAYSEKDWKSLTTEKFGKLSYEEKVIKEMKIYKGKTPQIIAGKIAKDISQKLFQRSFNDLKSSDTVIDMLRTEQVVGETKKYYKEMKKYRDSLKTPIKENSIFDLLPKELQKKIQLEVDLRSAKARQLGDYRPQTPEKYADTIAHKLFNKTYEELLADSSKVGIARVEHIDSKYVRGFFGDWKKAKQEVPEVFKSIPVKEPKTLYGNMPKAKELPMKTITEINTAYKSVETVIKTKVLDQVKQANKNDSIKYFKKFIDDNKLSFDEGTKRIQKLRDGLASDEALEFLARDEIGNKFIDDVLEKNKTIIKTIVDTDDDLPEKIRSIVKEVRKNFKNMSISEENAGVLSRYTENYVAHILNPKIVEILGRPEIDKIFKTNDFGFGQKSFNPHDIHRTVVKGKKFFGVTLKSGTIKEINSVFRRETGKDMDFFLSDIADIYYARALKNNQIVYDGKLTDGLMNMFGNKITDYKSIENGMSAVVNTGAVLKQARKIAKAKKTDYKKILSAWDVSKDELEVFGMPLLRVDEERFLKMKRSFGALPIRAMPDVIINKANKAGMMQKATDTHALLSLFDRFQTMWKVNVTAVIPGFHGRNKLSNQFNSWLGLGSDVLNINLQKETFKVYRDIKAGKKITGHFITDLGKKISYEEVARIAEKYEIIDSGVFRHELVTKSDSTGLLKSVINGKFDPTDVNNFAPYKLGRDVGSTIENHDKFTHLVVALKQGMSPNEAVESVNKFLFDYGDLTNFELNVMRRIVPFYTWMRKNTPMQLEQMLNQPEKYRLIAKAEGSVESTVKKEDRINKDLVADYAKDYLQLPFNVDNPEGNIEPILYDPNMPYGDLNRLTPKEMFSMMSPMIKIPIELATNRNVYFENKIDRGKKVRKPGYIDPIGNIKGDPGEMSPRVKYVLDQMASVKLMGKFLEKKGADLGFHSLNTLLGIKTISYDYDKFKWQIAHDYFEGVKAVAKTKAQKEALKAFTPPSKEQIDRYEKSAQRLRDAIKNDTLVNPDIRWVVTDSNPARVRKSIDPNTKENFIPVKVIRVIDGDTIAVDLEDRYGNKTTNVRMLLVDTPETVSPDKPVMPFGEEASNYAKRLLSGKDVKLYYDTNELKYDRYGRIVAYVHVGDVDYNKSVLEEGYAKVSYVKEEMKRLEEYKKAEEKAYKNKKGVWSIEGYAEPIGQMGYNTKAKAIENYLKNKRK